MSIGPLNPVATSIVGTPTGHMAGADAARAAHEAANQQVQAHNNVRAENAAGIGATDGEDNQASDRDADGRRLWERTAKPGRKPAASDAAPQQPLSRDPKGETGQTLDLSG